MKELSVFVDESGDYGEYNYQSPYYIVTLVLHNQTANISKQISTLNTALTNIGIFDKAIHTGPIIRRELEYRNMEIDTRKKIFNCLFNFSRKVDYHYKTFVIEKKQINDSIDLYAQIAKQLSAFITSYLSTFTKYDRVIVYYDNGQIELTKILVSVFNAILQNVDFRRVFPADYKLFQVADLVCTLELIRIKESSKTLSKSEMNFFTTLKQLKKSYLEPIENKRVGFHI
jgi:hypothetical protein